MAKYSFDVQESIPKGLNNNSHRCNLWNYFVLESTPKELNDSKDFSLKSIPLISYKTLYLFFRISWIYLNNLSRLFL